MAIEDVIVIAVILFSVAVGLFLIGFVGDTIGSSIASQPVINESSAAVAALNALSSTTHKFDTLFAGLFFGLVLGMIILTWFVPSHPIFMVVYMLVLIVGVILSSILANVWEQVTNHAQIASFLVNMPIANHVISFLPLYVSVIGFIGMVILFAKPQGGGV